MVFPLHAAEKYCTLIISLKNKLERALPNNIQTHIVCTGTKLASQLKNIKDPTTFEDQNDIVYCPFCSAENCSENYNGAIAWRLDERMKNHNDWERYSYLFKHSVESGHRLVLKNGFRIIGKGYRNSTCRRKKVEAIFSKKMEPSLNIQEKSIKLELLN